MSVIDRIALPRSKRRPAHYSQARRATRPPLGRRLPAVVFRAPAWLDCGMVRRSSRCAAFALASVTALVPIRSVALSVTPMSLAEAVGAAECIVHGTVSEVRSGRDERGLPATWVTLRVARMLKGGSARELRFKQFGLAAPEATGALPMPFLPRYRQGAEMVLLLRRPSRHGFTSPVDPALGAYAVAGGPETGGAGAHAGLDAAARDDLLRALAELIEAQR